jgi:hypothetical protein
LFLVDGNAHFGQRLPVGQLVVLRDFARWYAAHVEAEAKVEVKAKAKANTNTQAEPAALGDFISERLIALRLEAVAQPLHQVLEDGQALVLCDGLDEIAGCAPARPKDALRALFDRVELDSEGRIIVRLEPQAWAKPLLAA